MLSRRDMQTANAEELRQVLAAAHILLIDDDIAHADRVASLLKRFGARSIELASNADEALDMLGYTSRAYDLVMLRAGLAGDGAQHVLSVLVRQAPRLRVTLHGLGDLASLPAPERFAGVARCIDSSGPAGIVRGVSSVLASDVMLADIARTRTVPPTMTADWAEAIYGALPGQPFNHPINR